MHAHVSINVIVLSSLSKLVLSMFYRIMLVTQDFPYVINNIVNRLILADYFIASVGLMAVDIQLEL